MEHIKNINIVKDKIGEWKPSSVAFIRDIFYQGRIEDISGDYFSILTMTLLYQPYIKHSTRNGTYYGWPNLNEKFWKIVIEFRDIHQFCLKNIASEIQTSLRLMIVVYSNLKILICIFLTMRMAAFPFMQRKVI